MVLAVNPNRMELLKLKKRLILARRGYKLLKDKRDALIQKFIILVHENRKVREEFEKNMRDCLNSFLIASSSMGNTDLDAIFLYPKREIEVKTTFINIMSVQVPHYEIIEKGDLYTYGMAQRNPELDNALKKYKEIIPLMMKMAEL
ncbi:MAG: V-type ATP synthase subunit D, partial [Atribacterota bacterium]